LTPSIQRIPQLSRSGISGQFERATRRLDVAMGNRVTMRKDNRKLQRSGDRKRQFKQARPQSDWFVGAAILLALVLGYLVMQTQTRLKTVQSELHRVSDNAVQAKARVVHLEHAAASLKREMKNADFKRNELQDQLGKANAQIDQLSEIVDTAEASHEDWQTLLESMRSELEGAKQSAKHAEAESADSKKQMASLKAKLDEINAKRHALQSELLMAQSDVKQLRSELNTAKSELLEMRSSLRAKQNKLEDAKGNVQRGALRKDSRTAKLKKGSLDATLPRVGRGHTALEHGSEGRDYLIRTIVFEASGETEIGKAAVAHVILNRKRNGRWGDRIQDVVTHPWQFEPWMTRKDEIEKLSLNDPSYLEAAKIADAVLAGYIPDPTAGATHFLNPVVVRQRRGGSLPSWADGDGQPIGRHVYYSPERGGTVPHRAEARRLQPTTSQHPFSEFLGAG
jgi:spore germination cell wall hydrolase CwlJ-like protein/peptidoglycan hydrolase CwlO-like protein